MARWKARYRLPISDNGTFFASSHGCGTIKRNLSKLAFSEAVGRSFILCGQGSSLLWTPALRPFESVQCASPGREGELIGVCGVRAM